MLKASLFAAAALAAVTLAAPIASAQGQGSRQIVVEPTGTESGAGAGIPGETPAATGDAGGQIGPVVDAPAAATPGDDAATSTDAAADNQGQAGQKVIVEPPPTAGAAGPATDQVDTAKAIIDDAPDAAVEPPPTDEPAGKAVAVAPKVTIDSPEGLVTYLKSKGYSVEVDHRDQHGDYVLVVSTEKDGGFGYLLTVDYKHGNVTAKQKIKLSDYGYGATDQYDNAGKTPDPGYDAGGGSDTDNAYDSGGEDDSGYGGEASGSSGY